MGARRSRGGGRRESVRRDDTLRVGGTSVVSVHSGTNGLLHFLVHYWRGKKALKVQA